MALLLIVLLPFIGSFLPKLGERFGPSASAICAAISPLIALGLLLSLREPVYAGQTLLVSVPWLTALQLHISLRLDGLGFLFALMILGIGLLVIVYARYYLYKTEPTGRFYGYLLLFMGAMLGVVLAENLILMMLFWELTSLASFLLIGFWSHKASARGGARMALTVTGGGGLALLAGVLLIGHVVGSYELSQVLAAGDQIRAHALYPLILVLVLLGVFTKSAQFPFHFWLPQAMSAPTPVSAYLHSATMVKAGVFLLARLYPALADSELWFYLVSLTGLATLLVGAVLALFQQDLKGLLAYSTISHLGLITLLFGLDSPLSNVAAVFHIINHATFKASLFMAAGIIDHETGSRDMRKLSGLLRYMPHTAALAMVASLAMAGVPLLNGFLSKEMFFAETLEQNLLGSFYWLVPAIATLAGAFAVAYSLHFVHAVFFGQTPVDLPKYPPQEPSRYMKIPVEILVLLCILVGMLPMVTVAPLLASAASASLGGYLPEYDLAIWHGLNLPLLMSCLALLGGVVIYTARKPLFRWYKGLPSINSLQVFEGCIQALTRSAQRLYGALDNQSVQRYLAWVLGGALVLLSVALQDLTQLKGPVGLTAVDALMALVMLTLSCSAVLTVFFNRYRLIAVLVMGVGGLMVALIFARYGAPDLALTQICVEVVSIILMLLALFFMPDHASAQSSSLRSLRDVLLALSIGTLVALLAFAVLTRPYDLSLAEFMLQNSVPGGGGHNVVNVILVDFRGFDTLGEICVLAVAAIGIFGLLHGLHLPYPTRDMHGRLWSTDSHPMILDNLSKMLLPMALMVSAFIFIRGHNLPGGGFIAGLITASALILQYISHGVDWTQARQPLSYHRLAGVGILLAGLTGLGSLVVDQAFLTTAFGHVDLGWLGEVELASALFFDLGVYLTVVGSTLLILSNIGHVSQDESALEYQ